jgi:hypothetical protein
VVAFRPRDPAAVAGRIAGQTFSLNEMWFTSQPHGGKLDIVVYASDVSPGPTEENRRSDIQPLAGDPNKQHLIPLSRLRTLVDALKRGGPDQPPESSC